jgi:type IV pilus assembly protein PilM
MANAARIYSLNLGTQTITLAEFQPTTSGGLVLTTVLREEVLGDPAVDATRVAMVSTQVAQMAGAMKIKQGSKVHCAVASHLVFTRPVSLPTVSDLSQVESIVGFEAQQNVPYPIDQVVWDWQLLDAGHDGQMEVILAAIKSDLLDEIAEGIRSAGFKLVTMDVAPMALYNSFRYSYSTTEGCTLLVDMGSRTTNLLFVEPGNIFPRRLNIGGSSLTGAIARDFGSSFFEADQRKVSEGFVGLGGGYADPDDPDVARISKIIRNQMTRLHQEIQRSVQFYRSEHSGSPPTRILLAGGTASLPYMREFFQEKFPNAEVEFFNPLANVAVGGAVEVESVGESAHQLGEVIGLALRGVSSCPMELNLRPPSVIRAESAAKQVPFLAVAGVAILAAIASVWFYFDRGTKLIAEQTTKLEEQCNGLRPIKERIEKSRDALKAKQVQLAPLLEVVRERDYWPALLNELNALAPKEFLWITGMKTVTVAPTVQESRATTGPNRPRTQEAPKPVTKIELSGLYLGRAADNGRSAEVFDEFVKNVRKSQFGSAPEEGEEITRETETGAKFAFDWKFPFILKNPIKTK